LISTSTGSHWLTVLSPKGEDIQVVENFGPDLPGYCLECVKFGRLILWKIVKIVVTRCQILRLKCTKFDVGWGWRGWEGRGKEGRGKGRGCAVLKIP